MPRQLHRKSLHNRRILCNKPAILLRPLASRRGPRAADRAPGCGRLTASAFGLDMADVHAHEPNAPSAMRLTATTANTVSSIVIAYGGLKELEVCARCHLVRAHISLALRSRACTLLHSSRASVCSCMHLFGSSALRKIPFPVWFVQVHVF